VRRNRWADDADRPDPEGREEADISDRGEEAADAGDGDGRGVEVWRRGAGGEAADEDRHADADADDLRRDDDTKAPVTSPGEGCGDVGEAPRERRAEPEDEAAGHPAESTDPASADRPGDRTVLHFAAGSPPPASDRIGGDVAQLGEHRV